MPISDQVLRDLRAVLSSTMNDSDGLASMNDAERLVFRVLPELLDEVERARASVPAPAGGPQLYPIDPAHTVRVQGADGVVRVLCDHKFLGAPACVHCRKSFDELRGESTRERELLERASVSVAIEIGPTLRPRIEALVATGRLGRDLPIVAQTLFILGMLDAEGHDPRAHVGEPMSHVSADALFVRFALPHEGSAERAAVLRQLFLDMGEWLGEADPLRRPFEAALEFMPR